MASSQALMSEWMVVVSKATHSHPDPVCSALRARRPPCMEKTHASIMPRLQHGQWQGELRSCKRQGGSYETDRQGGTYRSMQCLPLATGILARDGGRERVVAADADALRGGARVGAVCGGGCAVVGARGGVQWGRGGGMSGGEEEEEELPGRSARRRGWPPPRCLRRRAVHGASVGNGAARAG